MTAGRFRRLRPAAALRRARGVSACGAVAVLLWFTFWVNHSEEPHLVGLWPGALAGALGDGPSLAGPRGGLWGRRWANTLRRA